jgi:Domain of unknown function (DUF4389)
MYPVGYEADYPGDGRNRLTTFFRYLIAIPWLIVVGLYGIGAYLAAIVAWFSIVFTGRYPEGIYNFEGQFVRMVGRVSAFLDLATDEYPPFHGNPDDNYPVRVSVPPAKAEYDRLKTGLRFIYGIPVILLNYVQAIIAFVIALIGWFAILFTGRLSEGLFDPLRSALAYQTRAAAYLLLMTEDWPPFSLEEGAGSAPATLQEGAPPGGMPTTPPPAAEPRSGPGESAGQ